MKINTPIVIIAYNRPNILSKLIKQVKKINPQKIYAICDGPKNSKDKLKVEKVRELFETNFKNSNLIKIYSEENLGLRRRVVSGLDKVFKIEENAIILEDDCIPDISFYKFCEEMLEKYKSDEVVFSITGDNFSGVDVENSYMFSKYFHSWGWATWKRSWEKYDDKVFDWPENKKNKWINKLFKSKKSRYYWTRVFDNVFEGRIDSWAYRWSYAHFKHSAASIVPSVNLVKNIGIGMEGTNTKVKSRSTNQIAKSLKFPLIHPNKVKINKKSDEIVENKIYSTYRNLIIQTIKGIF